MIMDTIHVKGVHIFVRKPVITLNVPYGNQGVSPS
jgi:hypothetical protein